VILDFSFNSQLWGELLLSGFSYHIFQKEYTLFFIVTESGEGL
jgi:hypothetical protein